VIKKTDRLYLVTRRDSSTEHLVRATRRTVALSHIASSEYDVRRVNEDDLCRLLPTTPIETAKEKATA
jgi:hypothetical protein